jgi:hypothetical protein
MDSERQAAVKFARNNKTRTEDVRLAEISLWVASQVPKSHAPLCEKLDTLKRFRDEFEHNRLHFAGRDKNIEYGGSILPREYRQEILDAFIRLKIMAYMGIEEVEDLGIWLHQNGRTVSTREMEVCDCNESNKGCLYSTPTHGNHTINSSPCRSHDNMSDDSDRSAHTRSLFDSSSNYDGSDNDLLDLD